MKAQQLKKELEECGEIPVFEIEVINRKTKEMEFLIIDIEVNIEKNKLVGIREAINTTEEKSNKIATTEVDIDNDFSLDHHLEELFTAIIEEICTSEFFELA